MKTVEQLLAMCEQSGDCIIWHGATARNRTPTYGKINIRREVYESSGKTLGKTEHVRMKCGEHGCLHRAHMVVKTRSQISIEVSKNPVVRLRRVAAIKRSMRLNNAKLDMDKARYIRESDKHNKVIALELGISTELARMVRAGLRWKESNHFAGFMR